MRPNRVKRWVRGASYAFTLNLADRRSDLSVRHVDFVREAARRVRQTRPPEIDGGPAGPTARDLEAARGRGGSFHPLDADQTGILPAAPRGGAPFFQSHCEGRAQQTSARRFREHLLRDQRDFERHVDYIDFDPVKRRLAARASDWPHSSIHRYIRLGLVAPAEWAWDDSSDDGFGARAAVSLGFAGSPQSAR
jgi:putative transposase